MSCNDWKFRDRAGDEYEIVSVGEMSMGWVATYKVFRQFDNFFLELVDISLLLEHWMHNFIAYVQKRGHFLKSYWENTCKLLAWELFLKPL